MKDKKIDLANFIATIELKGMDAIKQDLKEIEDRLDRILAKYEKINQNEFDLRHIAKEGRKTNNE